MHSEELPLVSCIMPTRGRPDLAAAAVAQFREQTYPNRELVIVDDTDAPSFLTPPQEARIRYFALPARKTIGAKRNIAISRSSGKIICHWDDDDRYSRDRIERQVRFLIDSGAELVGCGQMIFEAPDGRRWLYSGSPGYVIGTSMCYWRDVWKRKPFRDVERGEDNAFWSGLRTATMPAGDMIVATIHNHNSSPRSTTNTCMWRPLGAA